MATPCNCDTFTSDVTISNTAAPQLVILGGGTVSLRRFPQGGGTVASVEAFTTDDPTLANYSRMRMTVDGNTAGLIADAGGSGVAMPLTLSAGGAERIRVTTAGNVGIGTANPGKPLEVAGGSAKLDAGIVFGPNSQNGTPGMHSDGTNLYLEANVGNLFFRPQGEGNNTNIMTLASNGYLGLNTTSPEALLHLNGGGLLVSGDASIQGRYYCVSRLIADSAGCYYGD